MAEEAERSPPKAEEEAAPRRPLAEEPTRRPRQEETEDSRGGDGEEPEEDARATPTRTRPEALDPEAEDAARGGLVELVVIVALALGLALGIQAWLVKPYQIPSESMEPTLDVGQRVLVNRFLYHFTDPSIGDIVVFHPPAGAENGAECGEPHRPRQACAKPTPDESGENFIKRIVAGPGDTLAFATATRSSTASSQDATSPTSGPAPRRRTPAICPKPITIPPDHYFMMGDNRGESDDSRFWGPVPRDWIIGKAFATYWPPDRIGIL